MAPKVFDAAYTWVEIADWIPAVLCGTDHPADIRRGICAAGHKALANPTWGGYPDVEFLTALDPRLAKVRESLPGNLYSVADRAGELAQQDIPDYLRNRIQMQDKHLLDIRSAFGDQVLANVPELERDVTGLKMIEQLAGIMYG